MALNLSALSHLQKPPFLIPNHKHFFKLYQSSYSFTTTTTSALSDGTESGLTEEDSPSYPGSLSSTRSQLDLLEQLTSGSSFVDGYKSDGDSGKLKIREQLAQLAGNRDDNFNLPLGKNLKKVSPKFLTVSQKRNIRRQAYLNEVSRRNDSSFFATIGAFVILPPLIILGIAILTGNVQLFP